MLKVSFFLFKFFIAYCQVRSPFWEGRGLFVQTFLKAGCFLFLYVHVCLRVQFIQDTYRRYTNSTYSLILKNLQIYRIKSKIFCLPGSFHYGIAHAIDFMTT